MGLVAQQKSRRSWPKLHLITFFTPFFLPFVTPFQSFSSRNCQKCFTFNPVSDVDMFVRGRGRGEAQQQQFSVFLYSRTLPSYGINPFATIFGDIFKWVWKCWKWIISGLSQDVSVNGNEPKIFNFKWVFSLVLTLLTCVLRAYFSYTPCPSAYTVTFLFLYTGRT